MPFWLKLARIIPIVKKPRPSSAYLARRHQNGHASSQDWQMIDEVTETFDRRQRDGDRLLSSEDQDEDQAGPLRAAGRFAGEPPKDAAEKESVMTPDAPRPAIPLPQSVAYTLEENFLIKFTDMPAEFPVVGDHVQQFVCLYRLHFMTTSGIMVGCGWSPAPGKVEPHSDGGLCPGTRMLSNLRPLWFGVLPSGRLVASCSDGSGETADAGSGPSRGTLRLFKLRGQPHRRLCGHSFRRGDAPN